MGKFELRRLLLAFVGITLTEKLDFGFRRSDCDGECWERLIKVNFVEELVYLDYILCYSVLSCILSERLLIER